MRGWLQANMLLCIVANVHFGSVRSTLVRRDERKLVIPLTYSPESGLLTASVSIGTPASPYDLIVDTGSPFLAVEQAAFLSTSSTWDAFGKNQPDMGDAGGYVTTSPTPQPNSKPLKPKMHFITDTAVLNEEYGDRASAGEKGGNVTVGLATLEGLKGAQGLLGLSPPFDKVGKAPPVRPGGEQGQQVSGEGEEDREARKEKRDPEGGAPTLPSLDVSFLHSFLSPDHRPKLGMTGSSHFYLSLTAPTSSSSSSALYAGELVFPLEGTTLPRAIPSYDYSRAITIDRFSGSTYPARPFWGAAHLPKGELSFFLDDDVLTNVKVDAILLDSGTSGIVGAPSEVAKIFAAAGRERITVSSGANSDAVVGKASCGATMKMGFEIGKGKRAQFTVVRQKLNQNGELSDFDYGSGQTSAGLDGVSNGLMAWKSYVAEGVAGYIKGVERVVDSVTDTVHRLILPGWRREEQGTSGKPQAGVGLMKRKRHVRESLHRQTHHNSAFKKRTSLQLGAALLTSGGEHTHDSGSSDEEADPKGHEEQVTNDKCDVTIKGSPEVEAMFPSNGPNFKPWIVGTDFFYQNLVYHNIDTAVTAIVPRYDA